MTTLSTYLARTVCCATLVLAGCAPVWTHTTSHPAAAHCVACQPRRHDVGLGFSGTRLTAIGMARLRALRPALRQTTSVRILVHSGHTRARSQRRAMRLAAVVAATLLRWGYPPRQLHIRIVPAHHARLVITIFSAPKDMTP